MSTLGLDVGGANLKAAHSSGIALSQPFELWKDPAGLAGALARCIRKLPPFDTLAVTMTGELCDCFPTRRHGVEHILEAVAATGAGKSIKVWQTTGRFVDLQEARASPLATASANWHALATWAGRFVTADQSLLIDAGSTTCDIIPLRDGKPAPIAFTDRDRLKSRELVYTGVRRTPVCALLGAEGAAEWFATTLDVYLLLGKTAENANDCNTADGRPATVQAAQARLARMIGADPETLLPGQVERLARDLEARQVLVLTSAIDHVVGSWPAPFTTAILAGSGEFLARAALDAAPPLTARVISLSQLLGPDVSASACAYALAVLAEDRLQ
jgi:(4-(4-[2-(gamma-L-glutamylamino)ethyl]phenoxymethyl)furan-2-yl)methanamine synthase